jgi:hypothetical protein
MNISNISSPKGSEGRLPLFLIIESFLPFSSVSFFSSFTCPFPLLLLHIFPSSIHLLFVSSNFLFLYTISFSSCTSPSSPSSYSFPSHLSLPSTSSPLFPHLLRCPNTLWCAVGGRECSSSCTRASSRLIGLAKGTAYDSQSVGAGF